jgi:hypothetical protein
LLLLLLPPPPLVARIIDSLCNNQWYYNFPNPCKLHQSPQKKNTPKNEIASLGPRDLDLHQIIEASFSIKMQQIQ